MGSIKEKHVAKGENSFKGTLLSVVIVGAVIVIMWVGVFSLYMSRF